MRSFCDFQRGGESPRRPFVLTELQLDAATEEPALLSVRRRFCLDRIKRLARAFRVILNQAQFCDTRVSARAPALFISRGGKRLNCFVETLQCRQRLANPEERIVSKRR